MGKGKGMGRWVEGNGNKELGNGVWKIIYKGSESLGREQYDQVRVY